MPLCNSILQLHKENNKCGLCIVSAIPFLIIPLPLLSLPRHSLRTFVKKENEMIITQLLTLDVKSQFCPVLRD